MDKIAKRSLVQAALRGMGQAFLTSPEGTRYGAAALTAGGATYSAGHYASFNHITNIHAEMSAILLATMAGDADVIALALVSSRSGSAPCRPCGVCRQFMAEHGQRTGKDILVLMARLDGSYEEQPISALLPAGWQPTSDGKLVLRDKAPRWQQPGAEGIPFGAAVRIGESEAIVWDADFHAGRLLVKWRYRAEGQGRAKLPHSTDEYGLYESWVGQAGLLAELPTGGLGSLLDPGAVGGVVHPISAPPEMLARLEPLLAAGGLAPDAVRVFGSRAAGTERPTSDWDLIVLAAPERIAAFRLGLSEASRLGKLQPTPGSHTLALMDRWVQGGHRRLFQEGRYNETFVLGGLSFSLAYQPMDPSPAFVGMLSPRGFAVLAGCVSDARQAAYKPGRCVVETGDGAQVTLLSYTKLITALREGDRVLARGWLVEDAQRLKLLQLNPERETLDILP
ncbi:MAG: hypothetical protein GXY76_14245 [Chloroflexi bacterium]|nr:hypothetical protein [Chloroflexota bacterium]